MSLPQEREGFSVKVAAKKQAAFGVPETAFVDADVLRTDEAPSPNPNVETTTNLPTGTGSPYKQSEAIILVGITPEIEATLKATPRHLRFLLEALLNKAPTTSAGPIGTIYKFEGFAAGIQPVTWVWDDGQEAIRAADTFLHTLEFRSRASEALMLGVNGTGQQIAKIAPQLASVQLAHFDIYAHKDSVIEDEIGGTPVSVFASEQTLSIAWSLIESRGNSVAPNFVGKSRMTISGTIRTRLYVDTAGWMDRILSQSNSSLTMRWIQQDGKTLSIRLNNVKFSGQYPGVRDDGTLDDFTLNFEAAQSGTATFPFVAEVED